MRAISALALLLTILVAPVAQTLNYQGLLKYSPPAGFKRNDSRAPEGRTAFFGQEVNNYSPSVMLKTHPAGRYTAKSLGMETVAEMKRASDIKVVTAKELQVSGKPAYLIQIELKLGNGMQVAQSQVISIHRSRAVIFSSSALKVNAAENHARFMRSLTSVVWI